MEHIVKQIVLTISVLYSTATMASGLTVTNNNHLLNRPNCCDKPPHISEHPYHPLDFSIKSDRWRHWYKDRRWPIDRIPNRWPCNGHACFNYDPLP